jgi:Fe-S oxidoreductase
MAQRGREAVGKRARERARQERQEAKRLRQKTPVEVTASATPAESNALMEEFHRLNEKYAAKLISHTYFLEERRRIFLDLGIEPPDDD